MARAFTMALAGKIVVVLGGTGFVGSGVVHSLLQHNAKVAVASRSAESIAKLQHTASPLNKQANLLVANFDIGSESGAENFKSSILKHQDFGRVDYVVAAIGSWWQKGPTTKQSLEEWNTTLHNLVGAHFVAAKTFLPLIADQADSSYTIVTGGAGERCMGIDSVCEGLVTVGAAALFGLSLALRAEFEKKPVRVNEFRLYCRVEPPEQIKPDEKWKVSNLDNGRLLAGVIVAKQIKGEVVRFDKPQELPAMWAKYPIA